MGSKDGGVRPGANDSAEQLLAHLGPGDQFAVINGLLDEDLPFITFVVEIPVPVVTPDLERVVVPMSALRTGEVDDSVVKIQIGERAVKSVDSSAVLDRLLELPDRTSVDRKLWRQMRSKLLQPIGAPTWVAELTTPNKLADTLGANNSEIAVRLFLRCLDGLNRYLRAHLVASEDYAIRPVRMESLGHFALVEFRDSMNRSKKFEGLLTLPRASPVSSAAQLAEEDLRIRIRTSMQNDRVNHPMDRVVAWEKRAMYHSFIGGDYEMSIVALMVSAEALVTSIWRTLEVDGDEDFQGYDNPPRFRPALKDICRKFGFDLIRGFPEPVENLLVDCYEMRNETVHEGGTVTHELLDVAMDAYRGFRAWIEDQTVAHVKEIPRTALLVHGPVGLAERSVLKEIPETLRSIKAGRELAFWLPKNAVRAF